MRSRGDDVRTLPRVSDQPDRVVSAFGQQSFDVESDLSVATCDNNLHYSTVLIGVGHIDGEVHRMCRARLVRGPATDRAVRAASAGAYDERVSRSRDPGRKPPKYDLAIARALYVLTGLVMGFAIGIFTGSGWLWLSIGLVFGILLAVLRTRPQQQIEED